MQRYTHLHALLEINLNNASLPRFLVHVGIQKRKERNKERRPKKEAKQIKKDYRKRWPDTEVNKEGRRRH